MNDRNDVLFLGKRPQRISAIVNMLPKHIDAIKQLPDDYAGASA